MSEIKNKSENTRGKATVRASISFPTGDYEKLEQAATRKRVSLAWIVREAIREYLERSQPHEGSTQNDA